MRETNGAKVRRGIEYKRESSDPGQVNIWFVCAKVRSSPLQGTLLVWSSKGWSKGESFYIASFLGGERAVVPIYSVNIFLF